jgi:tetratricopeptide (TPR) repeat protein
VVLSLVGLSSVYKGRGKYFEAEAFEKRALVIREKSLGEDHMMVARTLGNLATIYMREGKYREAEEHYKRAMVISEKVFGAEHPDVAATLDNLALVYSEQGRDAEAMELSKRALAIYEKALGPEHPDVAQNLNHLALLYEQEGKYAEAEELQKRALASKEKILGADHPSVASTLHNLGSMYLHQGKDTDAERFIKRALAIYEKKLGSEHHITALTVTLLGASYQSRGDNAEAERLFKRALAANEKTMGARHPDVARLLYALAMVSERTGNTERALDYSRRATAAVIAHAASEMAGTQRSEGTGGLVEQRASYFADHIANLATAAQKRLEPEPQLGQEALVIAQWATQSAAAAAVQQMGLRFAAGSDALAALVRERQDLTTLWRERDKALIAALSQPQSEQSPAAIGRLRDELAATEGTLAANTARLEREFPEYAALANPKPLKSDEVQQLLGPDEALLFFLVTDSSSYVFALTRDGFEWKTIPVDGAALEQKIANLRRGLDVDSLRRGLGRPECAQAEADKRGLARTDCAAQRDLFDLALAYELYETLIGPIEALIKDKRHLIVAPSGPLTALPFHLLVTEKPATAAPGDLAAYRNAQWLIRRHAVSVLPSVASLKAVRVLARKEEAKQPLVGFGDPIFNADEENKPGAEQRKVAAMRSYTEFWRGVDIDPRMLSQALPRLPETAAELRAVATNLGAPTSSIHLRQDASETAVKRAALADYRVVYFATHGLVAGEVKGLAEPSLALTLPRQPSETDDGLLTASEVAQLKLNADWVVLSACNTIAGDKPGAEALSGLARAFFYAGARAPRLALGGG